jgi:hypothetical protein
MGINIVSFGSALTQVNGSVLSPLYIDERYSTAVFRTLLCDIDEHHIGLVEFHSTSQPAMNPLIEVRLSHLHVVYLQRAMMTFVGVF